MKTGIKISLIILFALLLTAVSLTVAFFAVTADAKLDHAKLINYGQSIIICDGDGNEIDSASLTGKRRSVLLKDLQSDTVNAFIASEDRAFYRHNGLNYKRMIKALFKNIAARSFKEGASTISQQLIKNTHLSNDKTLKRKLKEIRLTKQLERRYSKDEILEMYLNTIYFGHNCYGLQSAADFYFGKNAESLNLEESATLVGLLTSPNNYSPFKNPEKCLSRRNTVLNNMRDCGFITEQQTETAKAAPLNAKENKKGVKYADYYTEVFSELDKINAEFTTNPAGLKIYTYMNTELQSFVENLTFDCDSSVVVTDLHGGMTAYTSGINGGKRQPGSAIKPILVYAPAIEEKKIHTFTKIIDEKVNFNGYTPENYDKKYRGKVTVTESVKQSLNVPAVKTLNNIGLSTAEKYANLMGIPLDSSDKNLALALGGMKYGVSLKDLCQAYTVFLRGGTITQTRFIKKIETKDGVILYKAQENGKQALSQGTCSLMNEMLLKTAKDGTARKLKNLPFDVAAKTGTCGNDKGNTDAYAIGYTSQNCIGVWLGDKNNERLNITGGGDCCKALYKICETLYSRQIPVNLETQKGTKTIEIDREEYNQNDKIELADDFSPKTNRLTVKCHLDNIPKAKNAKFSNPTINKPKITVINNQISIELCQTKYYSYRIIRKNGDKKSVIYDGVWKKTITDEPKAGCYEYEIIPYYFDGKTRHYGKSVILSKIIVGNSDSPNLKPPDIVYKDWTNL